MALAALIVGSLAVVCSLAALVVGALAFQRASQAGVTSLPAVAALRDEFDKLPREVATVREEWRATLASLDAAMEALEERTEGWERRRRKAQGAADRAKQLEEGHEQNEDGDAVMLNALRKARGSGIPV